MNRPRCTTGRGPIQADALYPIATFLKRLGIGRHSLAALRRRGLPVRMIGTRAYIDGSEALETLRRLWRDGTEPPGESTEEAPQPQNQNP